jgi:hypothetical protein
VEGGGGCGAVRKKTGHVICGTLEIPLHHLCFCGSLTLFQQPGTAHLGLELLLLPGSGKVE